MIKWIIDVLKPIVGIFGIIIIIPIFLLVLAWICGCVTYFLLSVAFPEYVSFDWYHWRFVALGFLHGVTSGLISYKKEK